MKIERAYPPNIAAIERVFPGVRFKPVIFCWGNCIFAPNTAVVEPFLIHHEAVHCAQQGADIEGWWTRYLADPQFRLSQEIPAHVAEFRFKIMRDSSRVSRRRVMAQTAARLADPIYRYGLNTADAKRLLARGIEDAVEAWVGENSAAADGTATAGVM